MSKKLEIDFETADRITVLTLKEQRRYLKKELADFKKGGKVKTRVQNTIRTQSSKRGDGIATKGFTKGKIK